MAEAQLSRDVHGQGEDHANGAPMPQPVTIDMAGFGQAPLDQVGHDQAGHDHAAPYEPPLDERQWDTSNVIALPGPAAPPSEPTEELSVWADTEPDHPVHAAEPVNEHVPSDPTPSEAQHGVTGAPSAALSEISPIFTALDHAERVTAEARQQPALISDLDAFEVGLLIPRVDVPIFVEAQPVSAQTLSAMLEQATYPQDDAPSASLEDVSSDTPEHAPQPPEPAAPIEDVPPDTAEKIAAEANATAIALEALKQLLAERLPELEAAAARQAIQRANALVTQPAHMRVSPPPMVPAHLAAASIPYARHQPRRRSGSMVGSFLAGFSCSWIVGAVLYVYLTMG